MNLPSIPLNSLDPLQLREHAKQVMLAHGLNAVLDDKSTAAIIADLEAIFGCYNNAAILASQREANLVSAQRPSSIHTGAKSLGQRLTRKTPARTEVVLTRPNGEGKLTIDPFTKFVIDGKNFYCRHYIYFADGQTSVGGLNTGVYLYAGDVHAFATSLPDGSTFETLRIPFNAFTVSDYDVAVIVAGRMWKRTDEALFTFGPDDEVFLDDTDVEGFATITFGDNLHGKRPKPADDIQVWCAKVGGARDNDNRIGSDITCPTLPELGGQALTAVTGGQDQPSPQLYKITAPQIARVGVKAASLGSKSEHSNSVLPLPNVADALVLGQDELARLDPKYNHPAFMNHVECVALPLKGEEFSDREKAEFRTYLLGQSRCAREVGFNLPLEAIEVEVWLEILIFNDGIEADVKAQASTAIQALFKRQAGLLSRSILLDDYKRAATVSSVVDEVRVKRPTEDLRGLKPWQYPKLRRAANGSPALSITVAFTDRRKGVVL